MSRKKKATKISYSDFTRNVAPKEKSYITNFDGLTFTKEDNITNDTLIEFTNGKGEDDPNE